LSRQGLEDLAARLRRRATLLMRRLPRPLRQALEQEPALLRIGISTAAAYGWAQLVGGNQLGSRGCWMPTYQWRPSRPCKSS
jgi:hypothetical protein